MVIHAIRRPAAIAFVACVVAQTPRALSAQAVRGDRIEVAPGRTEPIGHENVLAGNDDGFTGPQNIGFDINFFGLTYGQLYVNNNGNVTFGNGLSTYTPFGLTTNIGRSIIAPFFADVDTRVRANPVAPAVGLTSFKSYAGASPFGQLVGGHDVFSVTWSDVGYFAGRVDKTNTFQLNLINRAETGAGNFDIEFNYDRVLWETGNASGGVNGLGGSSAVVGFSKGTGEAGTFVQLAGSAVNGALLDGGVDALTASSFGSPELGRYVFQVRNSEAGVPGATEQNPQLPSIIIPGDPLTGTPPVYVFNSVASGRWFDPPDTDGFQYDGIAGTFFSAIGLPTGFSPFNVCWGARFATCSMGVLGGTTFTFASAVDAFRVTGIDPLVDSSNPNGFPSQLYFTTGTGSFSMTPLIEPSLATPEPQSWILLGAGLLALGAAGRRRRLGATA